MKKNMLFIGLLLLATFGGVQCLYQKVQLSQQNGAACLDGSPPILFIDEGSQNNKDKFLLYIHGGGNCIGEDFSSCLQRSLTPFGSSKSFGETINLDNIGLMSTLEKENPVFHDWTKVFIQNCDGFLSLSRRSEPFDIDGKKLYFRGNNNIMESFKYLQTNFDIFNQDTVVLAGQSAGGLAATFYVQHLASKTITSKIRLIADSGQTPINYLVNGVNFAELAVNSFGFSIIDPASIPDIIFQCMQRYRKTFADCWDFTNLVELLTVPSLFVQSPYDTAVPFSLYQGFVSCTNNLISATSLKECSDIQRQIVEDLRIRVINDLIKMSSVREDISIWAPSCAQHVFIANSSFTKEISGFGSPAEAVQIFLDDPHQGKTYFQYDPWPATPECSAIDLQSLEESQKQALQQDFQKWKAYGDQRIIKAQPNAANAQQANCV